jgi:hypothetical protein
MLNGKQSVTRLAIIRAKHPIKRAKWLIKRGKRVIKRKQCTTV